MQKNIAFAQRRAMKRILVLLSLMVLVACAGQTSQQGLKRAKILLENVNAKVMGGVLNKIEAKSSYDSYH